MGLKISAVVCDRCGREFSPPDGYRPGSEPKFLLRSDGVEKVRFEELCDFCDKEVNILLLEIADPKKAQDVLKKAEEELARRKEEAKNAPTSESKEAEDTKKPEPAKEQEGQKKEDAKETKGSEDGYGF